MIAQCMRNFLIFTKFKVPWEKGVSEKIKRILFTSAPRPLSITTIAQPLPF